MHGGTGEQDEALYFQLFYFPYIWTTHSTAALRVLFTCVSVCVIAVPPISADSIMGVGRGVQ